MEKETTKKESAIPGVDMDDFVNTEPTGEEDSHDEGNLPEGEGTDLSSAEGVEDSPEGQPAEGKKQQGEDVSAAISQATEKTMKKLEMVVGLLKDNPEKLKELEKADPQLINKLRNRNPELFKEDDTVDANKASSLQKVLKTVLDNQEKADFAVWRKSNKISEADYKKYAQDFEDTARELYNDGTVKTWAQALDVAGVVAFPHLSSSPVDESALDRIQNQGVDTSSLTPADDDFDINTAALQKKTGLSESELKQTSQDEFMAPGIN